MEHVIYLKLGGSLITDKRRAESARGDVLVRLAQEIAEARAADPALRLVVGHGSGSFGHVVGRKYGTRAGVTSAEQWYGFAATADAAARLNRLVTAALLEAGLPAWSIQPGASLRCVDGVIAEGPERPVARALEQGLVPLVFGDVALDTVRGGTIASTEEIFEWLADHIPARRMVLAGEVDGIFSADPQLDPAAERVAEITPLSFAAVAAGVGGSHGVDVTGGMAAKVAHSLALVQRHPGLEILVCSGMQPGFVSRALLESRPTFGTLIHT